MVELEIRHDSPYEARCNKETSGSTRSSSIASDDSGCSEVTDESQASSKTILNVDASVQTTTYEKKAKRTKGFVKWKLAKLPTYGRQTRRKRRLNKALDKLLRRILRQMNYSPEYEGRVVVPYHHPGAKPRLVQIAPRAMNEVSETSRVISSAIKVSVERPLPSWIDRVNNAFRMKLKNCKEAPKGILKDLTGSKTKVTKDTNSAWQYFNCTDEEALLDPNDYSSSSMCTVSRQYPLRANTNLSLSKSRLSLFNFLCKVCPCVCLESAPLRILY
ncbi:uncharacterized protein LOC107271595 isoform X2 [Cephus cinctus]|uniref:Uncharacterized protein LOC107271595 isoform X2 n=1 Tax=Cephus cinctus TaxID=211228 RepID=A0AAJ7RP39_CEPCN|nr:uncharacterized protein LOC107271595 isoform X2 [Cephus cinctus]